MLRLTVFLTLSIPVLVAGAWAPEARADDAAVGDVFVTVPDGGGLIFLDGATTGIVAPGVVHGVPTGNHTIRVDDACRTGSADVTVRANAVERVTVTPAVGTGTVTIAVSPPETRVTEGEKELGTGSFGPVVLSCGTHTLVGSAPGRQSVTYTAEVPLRGHLDLRLDLPSAAIGSIAITPTPLTAEVFVDGVSHGSGPMTVDGLNAGAHQVSARMDGYLPTEQTVNVVAMQIVRTSIELAPKPPPVSLGKRLGLDRVRWGRVGANVGVTLAAAGLGVASWLEYRQAQDGYATYTGLTYADDPDAFYRTDVERPRTLSYVLGSTGGAALVGAGALWVTTTPKPAAPAPTAPATGASATPAAPAPMVPATPIPHGLAPTSPALELQVVPAPTGLLLVGRF
jgi:hypothetical protein